MADQLEEDLDTAEPEDWDGEELEDLEDLDDVDADVDSDDDGLGEGDDDSDDDAETAGEPLDELEAEELEMLTEDEEAESLPVDEAEELREIRRATMSLESAAESAAEDEFVCASCFLVKSGSQLVDKRKKLCRDCA